MHAFYCAVESNQSYLGGIRIPVTDCKFQAIGSQGSQHLAFASVIALMIVAVMAKDAGSVEDGEAGNRYRNQKETARCSSHVNRTI